MMQYASGPCGASVIEKSQFTIPKFYTENETLWKFFENCEKKYMYNTYFIL